MHIADLAIATVTWARSAPEHALLRRSLERLDRLGRPISIGDRGDNRDFLTDLQRLQNVRTFVVPDGLVPQVQKAVELAAQLAPFVLYTEPDKDEFFAGGLEAFIEAAPGDDGIGVVLASRSSVSLETFPPIQRYAESVVNRFAGDVIGIAGDYSYGPFLMHRLLVEDVLRLDPRLGWGWRHATFVAAARRGLRVRHVSGDFACPADQQSENDGDCRHRLRQLNQNLLGLIR